MPILFIGHGNPMHAIEDNPFREAWTLLGQTIPRPKAVLMVSAHWMTRQAMLVDRSANPRTIHDFGNFPQELFDQQYPAPGAPAWADAVAALLADFGAVTDTSWGLDHGAWTVLKFLYPEADVPVLQLSIDLARPLLDHLRVGAALASLRDRGVLIIGSGNIVHNLGALRSDGVVYDWARTFDEYVAERLIARDFAALADPAIIKAAGLWEAFQQSHPSIEHYIPALTAAGAADPNDDLHFFNASFDLGALSMRSFIFYGS